MEHRQTTQILVWAGSSLESSVEQVEQLYGWVRECAKEHWVATGSRPNDWVLLVPSRNLLDLYLLPQYRISFDRFPPHISGTVRTGFMLGAPVEAINTSFGIIPVLEALDRPHTLIPAGVTLSLLEAEEHFSFLLLADPEFARNVIEVKHSLEQQEYSRAVKAYLEADHRIRIFAEYPLLSDNQAWR